MKRTSVPFIVLMACSACTTNSASVLAEIRAKPPVVDLASSRSADELVTCITQGLHGFDREVTLEHSSRSVGIVVSVMEAPQYVVDVEDRGAVRQVTMRRRTMLFQTASGPLAEVVTRCAA